MRALTYLMIAAAAAPVLTPAAALAQSPERLAVEACGYAVPVEVRDQYPQAYGIRITNSVPTAQGRSEVAVRGQGEFDDRNGGAGRFDYSCVYDARANRTYGLDVYGVRPKASPGDKKKDNSAAIAGLVLGAIVVGALGAGSDKDNDRDRDRDRDRRREWSPEPGVRCNAREAACYKDGRYSEKWTRRTFVR